jgi:ubiquinone/menaquinone biosynthesis C-methylase UbiE
MDSPDQPKPTVDAHYHRHTGKFTTRRISMLARQRVYERFAQSMRPAPGDRVLDVGASDDTGADSNMLEQLYPYRAQLTCASLSDGRLLLAAYPGVRHVQIVAGQPLPFKTNEFDIVHCNAVLEHAGSRQSQREFIHELCRVAPRRFMAVPNRRFPVEHHTCLPLLHWLPRAWFRWLLRGTRYDVWSHEENLNFISAADICAMWPTPERPTIAYAGLGLGSWKSNLLIYQTGSRT